MRKYLVGAVLLGLLVVGARGVHDLLFRPVPAFKAVASHPAPPLYGQADLASYTPRLDTQAARAAALMKGWWSARGTRPQDQAFAAWVGRQVPKPPSARSRKAEAAGLEKLAASRNPSGTKAAAWLKQYGARDLWLYYEHKQTTGRSKKEQATRHRQLERVLHMSRRLGMTLNQRLRQPAPFVLDPAVRPGKQAGSAQPASGQSSSGQAAGNSSRQACPCSYPAGADASTAGGSAYLAYLYPQQASLYRHMADEYEYAQLYLGSRLPSDLGAGRLLGDMVADYVLVTRGDGSVQQVTAALDGAGGSSHARSAGAPGSSVGQTAGRG